MADQWRPWPGELPVLDMAPCRAALVVAPHPDDEVLGAGGLMRTLRRAGVTVDVVAVTDGEASHRGSPTVGPAQVIRLRVGETVHAYRELGLDPRRRRRLGLPDSHVADCAGELEDHLRALLTGRPGLWCIAPWWHDGHPDHNATGRAALAASSACGILLLGYLVSSYHHGEPPEIPSDGAVRLPLDADLQHRKRAALARYVSQLQPLSRHPADTPVLSAAAVAASTGPEEVFVTAPGLGAGGETGDHFEAARRD